MSPMPLPVAHRFSSLQVVGKGFYKEAVADQDRVVVLFTMIAPCSGLIIL